MLCIEGLLKAEELGESCKGYVPESKHDQEETTRGAYFESLNHSTSAHTFADSFNVCLWRSYPGPEVDNMSFAQALNETDSEEGIEGIPEDGSWPDMDSNFMDIIHAVTATFTQNNRSNPG